MVSILVHTIAYALGVAAVYLLLGTTIFSLPGVPSQGWNFAFGFASLFSALLILSALGRADAEKHPNRR